MKKFFTLIAMMFASSAMMLAQETEWGPNLFSNSDFSGDDFSGVAVKNNTESGAEDAIQTGEAVVPIDLEGNKAIKVMAYKGAANAWQSQFWIVMPPKGESGLEVGEKFRVTFKYKCVAPEYFAQYEEGEEAHISVDTQAHGGPGEYHYHQCIGTLQFTQEWQTYEAESTVSGDWAPFGSIAFNLSPTPDYDVEYYFDDITVQYEKQNEEIVKYWAKAIFNGDFEGEDLQSFSTKIAGVDNSAFGAKPTIEDGIGVDGSRGLRLVVAKGKQNWEQQFFVTMKEAPEGRLVRMEFDIRADKDQTVGQQVQGPGLGAYIGGFGGNINVTTEWQHVSKTISNTNNDWQHISIDMAGSEDNVFYVDNFDVRIQKEGSIYDGQPEFVELRETVEAMESIYGDTRPANSGVRDAFKAIYEEAQGVVDDGADADWEALTASLTAAKSKLDASIRDYQNLQNYIDWANAKMALAKEMGAHYAALADQIDEVQGGLQDQIDAEAWTGVEIADATKQSTIKAIIAAYIKDNAKDGDDITILLENPDFAGNTSGWTRNGGSTGLDYGPQNRNILDMEDGHDGFLPTGMCEVWHGSYNVYQELVGLPAGLYKLTVNAAQRADEGTDMSGVLYGIADGQTLTQLIMDVNADGSDVQLFDTDGIKADGTENSGKWPDVQGEDGKWRPNGKGSANYHLNNGEYLNTVNILMENGGDLRIGVMDNNTKNWVVLDNFKLYYYSLNNVEAFAAAVENQITRLEGLNPNDYSDPVFNDVTGGIAEARTMLNNGGYTIDQCKEMNTKLGDIYNDAIANGNVIKALTAARDNFESIYFDNAYDPVLCTAAVKAEADKVYAILDETAYMAYTTEQLNELMTQMSHLCDAMLIPVEVETATDEAPVELTDLIQNNTFVPDEAKDGGKIGGWQSSGNGYTVGYGHVGEVGEMWQSTSGFKNYQTLRGLPAGTYTLSANASSRPGAAGDIAHMMDIENNDSIENENPAWIYAIVDGEKTSKQISTVASVMITREKAEEAGVEMIQTGGDAAVTSWTDEESGVEYVFPSSNKSADDFINLLGCYEISIVFQIKEGSEGTIEIGIDKPQGANNDWVFVDNFKLFYHGANSALVPSGDATGINTIQPATAANAIYTITGVRVNSINKAGLYIINGKKVLVK